MAKWNRYKDGPHTRTGSGNTHIFMTGFVGALT